MSKKYLRGIWTPTARVLCYKCHGKKIYDKTIPEDAWAELLEPVDEREFYGVTICDKCEREIQLDGSIAKENNLALLIRKIGIDANMVQTGGMMSGVEIKKKGDPDKYYLIVYEGEYIMMLTDDDGHGKLITEKKHGEDILRYVKKLKETMVSL